MAGGMRQEVPTTRSVEFVHVSRELSTRCTISEVASPNPETATALMDLMHFGNRNLKCHACICRLRDAIGPKDLKDARRHLPARVRGVRGRGPRIMDY